VPADAAAAPDAATGEQAYRWVREMGFQPHAEAGRAYALALAPGAALYASVRAGYALAKRPRADFENVSVPAKVWPRAVHALAVALRLRSIIMIAFPTL
jgi:hypothetical protein